MESTFSTVTHGVADGPNPCTPVGVQLDYGVDPPDRAVWGCRGSAGLSNWILAGFQLDSSSAGF